MNSATLQHTESTLKLLSAAEADRDSMLHLGLAVLGDDGAPIFPLDFLAIAAVKRNVSISQAISSMIEAWNMVAARTLLRVHIDTALRFSAAWLVENPHEFARRVLNGDRFDQIKDRHGNQLRDTYLVDTRCDEYPWVKDVYKNLSGYVHFSNSHIFSSLSGPSSGTGVFEFVVSSRDTKFPEFSWNEILKCALEANEMLAQYLRGYAVTKQNGQSNVVPEPGDG